MVGFRTRPDCRSSDVRSLDLVTREPAGKGPCGKSAPGHASVCLENTADMDELTTLGQGLSPVLDAMNRWALTVPIAASD